MPPETYNYSGSMLSSFARSNLSPKNATYCARDSLLVRFKDQACFNSGSLVSDPTLLVATATSNHALQHQHHQALLQSLSLAAPSQQTLDAPVPTRSLFPGAPDPLAASSSLASLLVKRNSLEQQRLLRSLDQQQPPNTVAGLSSSPLLNLLTPAQRLLLLSDAKHHNVGGIGGSSDSVNELSPLLLALLVQQQQRDIDESNGSSAGF
jgi:hypothetical protein